MIIVAFDKLLSDRVDGKFTLLGCNRLSLLVKATALKVLALLMSPPQVLAPYHFNVCLRYSYANTDTAISTNIISLPEYVLPFLFLLSLSTKMFRNP